MATNKKILARIDGIQEQVVKLSELHEQTGKRLTELADLMKTLAKKEKKRQNDPKK